MRYSFFPKIAVLNPDQQFATPFHYLILRITVIISVAFYGCATGPMSLDEALRTNISVRGKSFVPPPRNIDDIYEVIVSESRKDGSMLKDWAKIFQKKLPNSSSNNERVDFYVERARAALQLGLCDKCIEDIEKAYALTMPEKFDPRIINIWANCELNVQNYSKAIELYSILIERRKRKYEPYAQLAYIYALTGSFDDAERVRNEALTRFRNRDIKLNDYDKVFKARLDYHVLNMKAKYKAAEPIMLQAIAAASSVTPYRPGWVQTERIRLIRNLIDQNRFIEAELEARRTIEESIRFMGTESVHLMSATTAFANVLLAQGRFTEAEKIAAASIQGYQQADLPVTFGWWSRSIETYCQALVAKGKYFDALKQYNFFKKMRKTNPYLYDAFYSNDKNVMLALVMTGNYEEAMELIENAYFKSVSLLGKEHLQSSELLAMRAMVKSSTNNLEGAYLDFSEAIPLIARSKTLVKNRLANHRFQLILESYLKLLSTLRGSIVEKHHSFSASTKALEASMFLNESGLQAAVVASTARMSINDPKLKELVRTEQDIQQQIIACQNLMQNLLVKRFENIDHKTVSNTKEMLDKLIAAREVIISEIEKKFPDYANLVYFRQPSITDIQSKLGSSEVIITIYTTDNDTFVFVIRPNGEPDLVVLQVGIKKLEALVYEIKKSIVPNSNLLGDLPAYNFSKAYELYSLLLKPIENKLTGSKHITFVTSGPLGQIPFSILITEPFQLEKQEEVLFSAYRKAPWLIKTISINTVPSVSSIVALRSNSRGFGANVAFVGFGDPLFNKSQLDHASIENKIQNASKADEETKLDIRGIRVIKDGNLDDKIHASCKIEALERLPDTADELLSLAAALNADPVRDVYLGKKASEKQVKSMDLSNRQVVAFATHALVPYDLDGLDQPAIALSASSVTGDEEDGLLTMAEILDLKLNADWVVLSACNTGAAEGAGAEAVSGLGRAFFYAGTKAVLVSMWPVETSSAKKLTTSIFQHLKENVGMDKAQAHQMAMIELIEGHGLLDAEGKIIASFAHPLFWAPFIIVGDHVTVNHN
jgi:CHAT domain-containing protein